eukprot:SAG11_NODE_5598_length_1513_cov_4.251768_1_plen_457_part_10
MLAQADEAQHGEVGEMRGTVAKKRKLRASTKPAGVFGKSNGAAGTRSRGQSFQDIPGVSGNALRELKKQAKKIHALNNALRKCQTRADLEKQRADTAERAAEDAQDLCDQAHAANASNEIYDQVQAKLDAAGEPPVLRLYAESLSDGRLPLHSIWYHRMRAAALNLRCKTTDRWRYDEEIYLFCSQMLNCDGARSAYEFNMGPRGTRRGKRKRREFKDLVTDRVNDPSLPSRVGVLQFNKRYPVPTCGIDVRSLDAFASMVSRTLGIQINPVVADAVVDESECVGVAVLLISAHMTDRCYAYVPPVVDGVAAVAPTVIAGPKLPNESTVGAWDVAVRISKEQAGIDISSCGFHKIAACTKPSQRHLGMPPHPSKVDMLFCVLVLDRTLEVGSGRILRLVGSRMCAQPLRNNSKGALGSTQNSNLLYEIRLRQYTSTAGTSTASTSTTGTGSQEELWT